MNSLQGDLLREFLVMRMGLLFLDLNNSSSNFHLKTSKRFSNLLDMMRVYTLSSLECLSQQFTQSKVLKSESVITSLQIFKRSRLIK